MLSPEPQWLSGLPNKVSPSLSKKLVAPRRSSRHLPSAAPGLRGRAELFTDDETKSDEYDDPQPG